MSIQLIGNTETVIIFAFDEVIHAIKTLKTNVNKFNKNANKLKPRKRG